MKTKFSLVKNYGDMMRLSYCTLNNENIARLRIQHCDNGIDDLYIDNLCVNPKYRRNGFATKIMKRAIQYYGHKTLCLRAKASDARDCGGIPCPNIKLLAFYESLGFRVVRYDKERGDVMRRMPQ